MKITFSLLFLVIIYARPFCQVNKLDPSTIPQFLKLNAHSVKREENISFEVKSIREARESVHEIITALDPAGEKDLLFEEYTDKFRVLGDVEIKIYTAEGVLQKRYKKKDLNAESTSEGLVADGKVYYLKIPAASFPITVTYDYDILYKGTLYYPDYEIQAPDQSVETTSFTANVPKDLGLRYKVKNILLEPIVRNEKDTKIYVWSAKNLPSISKEEGSVSVESRYPKVLIAPNQFDMDGNPGDFISWRSFGEWYRNLNQAASNLSDERKEDLRRMVKDVTNSREKIKILYEYLQANFRYVSIQLGIGGLRSFPADFVDHKKYGDCKALSHYFQACLSAVGINSFPALVNASFNEELVDPNFPHYTFNHVIICVPNSKDTIWLECTSKTEDFGILGSFTENRNALLITDNGGVLVSTPRSKSDENKFTIKTSIYLKEDGSGECKSEITSTGEYKQELINSTSDEKKDDQKLFLVNKLGFPPPEAFTLKNKDSIFFNTVVTMELEKIPAFSTGSKMFLNPRLNKIWNSSLPNVDERKQDFYFEHPFEKTDTTVYYLPAGFTVEVLPKAKELKFSFGSFRSNYILDTTLSTITTYVSLILLQNKIPPEKYKETRKFFDSVLDEYSDKIVISRN